MKTTFTCPIFRTFVITFIVAISTLNLTAQTTHNVAVTDYAFAPKQITIKAGDKVVWKNTEGSHNVNGKLDTYPSNPEPFGNAVGTNWSYEYTFTKPGTYSYQCDPHAGMGMVGTVTVTSATANKELADNNTNFKLYPNPASQYIDLLLLSKSGQSTLLKIYSTAGSLIDQKVLGTIETYRYDLKNIKNGAYFIEISSGAKTGTYKFIKQ